MAYNNNAGPTQRLKSDPTLAPDAIVFKGDYKVLTNWEDPSTPLFEQQHTLPLLPVPELSASLSMYLESVAALATPEQLEKARIDAYEFLSEQGVGKTLQERLLQRQQDNKNSSWLQEWWNKFSYLEYREPVVM